MRVATCSNYVDLRIWMIPAWLNPSSPSSQGELAADPAVLLGVGDRPQHTRGANPRRGGRLAALAAGSGSAERDGCRVSGLLPADQGECWASRALPSFPLSQARPPSMRRGPGREVVERRPHHALRDVDLALGDLAKGLNEIREAAGLGQVSVGPGVEGRGQHRQIVRSDQDHPSSRSQLADQPRGDHALVPPRRSDDYDDRRLMVLGLGNQVSNIVHEADDSETRLPLQRFPYCVAEQLVPIGQDNSDFRELFLAGRHSAPLSIPPDYVAGGIAAHALPAVGDLLDSRWRTTQ